MSEEEELAEEKAIVEAMGSFKEYLEQQKKEKKGKSQDLNQPETQEKESKK